MLMKKSMLLILFFSWLALSAQVHTTSKDSLSAILSRLKGQDSLSIALVEQDPDSSAIGDPNGEKATRTIGPGGGTISSVDGMMELVFPAGALTAPTEIGLQSVGNTCVGGFGNAYACTPDGIRFQKPVDMVIHYTDSAAKGISPRIQTIRWQDKKGKWSNLDQVKTDSAAHTIHGKIEHFSTYVGGAKFTVLYPYPPTRVGDQRLFKLVITGKYPDGRKYTEEAAQLDFWGSHLVSWSINDVADGDDTWGTIIPTEYPFLNCAIYIAPARVPRSNPVISAKYMDKVPLGDGSADGVIATRTIVIYDEFHYSFKGIDKMGHLEMIDSSSCDIRIESSGGVKMTNVQNPVPWSDWPPKEGKCTYEYPDKTGWKGLVQISATGNGAYIGPDRPKALGEVVILLPTTMGSSPRYIQHCPGKTSTIPSMPVAAQPTSISIEMRPDGGLWLYYGRLIGKDHISGGSSGQGFEIRVARK